MSMAREHETSAQPWGTLEELLLACAVNRHGPKSWDSIALELQNRRISSSSSSSSSSFLLPSFTPQLCKEKFFDLKGRFLSPNDAASPSTLVDQLRRIRIEELRREVQQRDDSIVSLELKVKRLVEERERSLKEETNLDDRQHKLWPEVAVGKPAAGDESGDLDDRSFNESNSTSQKPEEATMTTVIIKDAQNDAGRAQLLAEPVEPRAENVTDPDRTGNGPGNERVNDEERENKKQMSDVQSSATLSKKKRSSGSSRGGGSSSGEEREGDEVSPANNRASAAKRDSMLRLLGILRSHRLGSAFDRRQRSQESERYKSLIRQHMDLQRIRYRLDKGVYSDCTTKFFRDLLLLFNNFIVFHPKKSPQYIAAQELRALVLKEMADKPPKQPPQTDRPNKASTIVGCRKRSSIKALTENAARREVKKEKKVDEKQVDTSSFVGINDKGSRKKRSKESAVSGRRNSLRKSNDSSGQTKHEYGGNELSSHDAMELKVKVDHNKENMARKKQGAASFLKRMKQNSPSEDDIDSEEDESEGKRDDVKRVTRSSGGRGAREESGRVMKRGVGRPPKRVAAAEPTGKPRREKIHNDDQVGVGSTGRARKRSRR